MPDEQRLVGSEDRLMISYEIHNETTLLESSAPDASVEYQMGAGQWPVQLELAMIGESVGSKLNFTFSASDNAFGVADSDRIIQLEAEDFSTEPVPGDLIEFELENNEAVEGQVLRVFDGKIEVDFNHPYAGRDLRINIHIKSIL